MPNVSLKHKNETFESLLRRWKNAVEDSEILKDARKYEAYERPGDVRKRARAAAVKREARRRLELEWQRLGIKPPKPKKERENKRARRQKQRELQEKQRAGAKLAPAGEFDRVAQVITRLT